ncbi:MAG: HD domain-containing phosphohydrolase [Bacillota bacterium]
MFKKADMHAWYCEHPERYNRINQPHADFLNISSIDGEGKDILDVLTKPEEARSFISDNKVVFQQGRKMKNEQSLTGADRRKHILKIVRYPIFANDDQVKGVFALAEDITEKRKAEKELYEREELFHSIIATLPDLLLFLDEEGRYLRIWTGQNANLYEEREKLLGKKIINVLPEQQAQIIMKNIEKALQEIETQVFEYELEVIGGKKWFEARMIASGNNRVVMVVRDITDRKMAHYKIEELHKVAVELASAEKEEKVYQLTVEAAERIFEFDVCTLDIVEDDMFVVKATSSGVTEGGSVSMPIEGVAGRQYRKQEALITPDITADKDSQPAKDEYRSAMTVPIDEYGIFQVISTEVNNFNEQDLKLTELLISHTSTAIKRLRAEQEIRFLGFHDKLTGLYNRMFVEEELKRLDSNRKLPISIIAGDVNSLKLVNDAFGHKTGDNLLKKVAKILQNSCRKEDIIGRFGGDEFTIILPNTDEAMSRKIIKRINYNCSKATDGVVPISIALGVSTKNESDQNIDEVVKEADANMYENKIKNSQEVKELVLDRLMKKLGEKRFESKEHCFRLKEMAKRFGKLLNLPEKQLDKLTQAAYIHDIGMISTPQEILLKKDELTREEWREIKKHPETGYRIARSSDQLTELASIILHHHERWDGQGYPRGLKKEEIPLEARIITLIDAYDSMLHKSIYKNTLDPEEAKSELVKNKGKQFDPALVDKFISNF